MAQLRQEYQEFVAREAEVVVVGPDSESAFRDYWQREDIPFVGLADPTHTVAKRYGTTCRDTSTMTVSLWLLRLSTCPLVPRQLPWTNGRHLARHCCFRNQ